MVNDCNVGGSEVKDSKPSENLDHEPIGALRRTLVSARFAGGARVAYKKKVRRLYRKQNAFWNNWLLAYTGFNILGMGRAYEPGYHQTANILRILREAQTQTYFDFVSAEPGFVKHSPNNPLSLEYSQQRLDVLRGLGECFTILNRLHQSALIDAYPSTLIGDVYTRNGIYTGLGMLNISCWGDQERNSEEALKRWCANLVVKYFDEEFDKPMTKYFCFDPRLKFSEPLYFQGKNAGTVEGWLSFVYGNPQSLGFRHTKAAS